MRFGVVLGGGGTAGYGWHTGVLAGLHDVVGLDARAATELVGTSAGSYAAAYLRAGFSGPDLYAIALGEAPSADVSALYAMAGPTGELDTPVRGSLRPSAPGILGTSWRARRVPGVGPLLAGLLPTGSVSAEPYLGPVRRLFEGKPWPAGLQIPAVRLADGVRVVFGPSSRVEVADAVGASSAVPAYMAPVMVAGERYVDGSLHAPTNADVLADAGLDVVIVSAPMAPPSDRAAVLSDLPVRAWAGRQLRREIGLLARGGTRVITLAPSTATRARMATGGMSEALRSPAARAAHAQMLEISSALAAQLS